MIGAFTRFIDIKYVENGYFDEWGDYVYEDLARLEFSFPNLYEFLSLSLVLSPVILFFVFVVAFSKRAGKRKYSIVFALIFACAFLEFISNLQNISHGALSFLLFLFLPFSAGVLGFISALTKFKVKALAIIASILQILYWFMILLHHMNSFSYYFVHNLDIYAWFLISLRISCILFGVTLLIFSVQVNKKPVFSTEEQLQIIKEKYELGIITQEEYSAQRMEVLSKI